VWEEVPPEAPAKPRPDARGFPDLPAFPEPPMPEAYDSREFPDVRHTFSWSVIR
jgi:hypothetical protein